MKFLERLRATKVGKLHEAEQSLFQLASSYDKGISMFLNANMYLYIYACVNTYIYIYIYYVYIYTHIYIHVYIYIILTLCEVSGEIESDQNREIAYTHISVLL